MAFMKPQAQYLTEREALEYCIFENLQDAEAGWYSRLSAPGYLDCTYWSGPFESEQEALDYIMETFDIDENGDDLEDE